MNIHQREIKSNWKSILWTVKIEDGEVFKKLNCGAILMFILCQRQYIPLLIVSNVSKTLFECVRKNYSEPKERYVSSISFLSKMYIGANLN